MLHFNINGEVVNAPKGTAVIYRPGEPQIYDNFGYEGTETFWIIFTGNKVEEFLQECGMSNSPVLVINAGKSTDYPAIFNELIVELQLKRHNYDQISVLLLKKILLEINRATLDNINCQNDLVNQIVSAAHYFNDNFNKRIIIDEYAQRLHMSPCWFIKNFKQILGITPMQYIVSKRIGMAKNLLITSNLSLYEIS
jgi:AraC-like DNA-binding protein